MKKIVVSLLVLVVLFAAAYYVWLLDTYYQSDTDSNPIVQKDVSISWDTLPTWETLPTPPENMQQTWAMPSDELTALPKTDGSYYDWRYQFTQSWKTITFESYGLFKREWNTVYSRNENLQERWPELRVYVSPDDTLTTFTQKLKTQYPLCDFTERWDGISIYKQVVMNEDGQDRTDNEKCVTSLWLSLPVIYMQEYGSGVFIITSNWNADYAFWEIVAE